jgi:NADPH:quinone reductase-like Zn-dependent oxidoreductase
MPSGFDRAFKDAAQAEMMDLLKNGKIRVPIGRVFDFDELPEALETLASGSVMGKLVVRGPV